jgi:hypothetical protein
MRMPPDVVLAHAYQCLSQPGGAHGQAFGTSFAPYQYRDVHRVRLTPRSRGPLAMACLSCGYASRQSQAKNEEESHGNGSAGNR